MFKNSKDTVGHYNLNKHSRNDGLNETESTANPYEQTTPSELSADEHLYELPPTGKFSTYSFLALVLGSDAGNTFALKYVNNLKK